MIPYDPGETEIVVSVEPAPTGGVLVAGPPGMIVGLGETQPTGTREYVANFYSSEMGFASSEVALFDRSGLLAGLAPAATEQFLVHWEKYPAYAACLPASENLPMVMREELLEFDGPAMRMLFGDDPMPLDTPRVWWNIEALELKGLLWEALAYRHEPGSTDRVSLVRGSPPLLSPPFTPVGDKLRVAILSNSGPAAAALELRLSAVPGLEVRILEGDPRFNLFHARREGYEILHLLTDGIVSLAGDGILDLGREARIDVAARDLASHLTGSRVTILCLSASRAPYRGIELVEFRRFTDQPVVHQAFSLFASEEASLPTTAALLERVEPEAEAEMWGRFYTALTTTYSPEQAASAARQGASCMPLALFLRHPQKRCFREAVDFPLEIDVVDGEPEIMDVTGDIYRSKEFLDRIVEISGEESAIPDAFKSFFTEEKERLADLESNFEDLGGYEGLER